MIGMNCGVGSIPTLVVRVDCDVVVVCGHGDGQGWVMDMKLFVVDDCHNN